MSLSLDIVLLKGAVVTASTNVIRLSLFTLFPDYLLFNSYVTENKPNDGKRFIRDLAKVSLIIKS